MAKIDAFFNLMFEQKASDLAPLLRQPAHAAHQWRTCMRVDYPPLENDVLKTMLYEIAPEFKIKDL